MRGANAAIEAWGETWNRNINQNDREWEAKLDAALKREGEARDALTQIAEYEVDWTQGPSANVGAVQDIAERALAPVPTAEAAKPNPPVYVVAREAAEDDVHALYTTRDIAAFEAGRLDQSRGKWRVFEWSLNDTDDDGNRHPGTAEAAKEPNLEDIATLRADMNVIMEHSANLTEALEVAREALATMRRMAAKPMKSWDAGSVIDAHRVDEEAEEAQERIAALLGQPGEGPNE